MIKNRSMISDGTLNAEVKTTDEINITTTDNDNNLDSKSLAAEDESSKNISEVLKENIGDFRKYIILICFLYN